MRFTHKVQVIIVNIHTTFKNQEEGYHSSKPLGEKQILKNNDNQTNLLHIQEAVTAEDFDILAQRDVMEKFLGESAGGFLAPYFM